MPLVTGLVNANHINFYGASNLSSALAAKFNSAFAGKITSIVVSGVKKCVSITITTPDKTYFFKHCGQLIKHGKTVKVIFTPKPLPITPAVPMPIVPAAGMSLTSALLIAGGVLIISACLYFGIRYAMNAMRSKEQNTESQQQPPPLQPQVPPLIPLPLPTEDSSSETQDLVENEEAKPKQATASPAPKLVAVSAVPKSEIQESEYNAEQKLLSSLNNVVKLIESRGATTEKEDVLLKKFKSHLKVKTFESGMLNSITSWVKQSCEKKQSYEEKLLLALKDVTLASNDLQNARADNGCTLSEKEQELKNACGPLLSKLIYYTSGLPQPLKLGTALTFATKPRFW